MLNVLDSIAFLFRLYIFLLLFGNIFNGELPPLRQSGIKSYLK